MLHTICRLPWVLLATAALVSCQTSAPAPSALESGHWTQVRKVPPTYFPKGISADHPTSFIDGSWVYAGDAQDTRFFIPLRNTQWPRKDLIAEAQAAMSPGAKRELARKRRRSTMADTTGGVVEGITGIIGAMGEAAYRQRRYQQR